MADKESKEDKKCDKKSELQPTGLFQDNQNLKLSSGYRLLMSLMVSECSFLDFTFR